MRHLITARLGILTAALCTAGTAQAATYTTPRQLNVNDIYQLNPDAFTGDENTTEPKVDANDGLSGDNMFFQRTNVARAHIGICSPNAYWYTSAYQDPGEPDPAGAQYVDYIPPFGAGVAELTPGHYGLTVLYRVDASRPTYNVEYVVHHANGTTTILERQDQGSGCPSFDLGTFDLTAGSFVRVNDTGTMSVTFGRMQFTYLGPLTGGVPTVYAGPDQQVPFTSPIANLSGSATDDGVPGALTTTWSKFSGPGTVTFGDANALATTATFSAVGTYVLRLTASDTANTATDDITVNVVSSLQYSTQYEFSDDPRIASGVLDANAGDVNGNGLLLVEAGTSGGLGATGSGITGGVYRCIDNSTSDGKNWGFYWAQAAAADVTFTIDMRVKVNSGCGNSSATRRSMSFSAGSGKNIGLRLNATAFATGTCTSTGSVMFSKTAGAGLEGCVNFADGSFHRLRVTANASTNTFHVYDLDNQLDLTGAVTGNANTTSGSWPTEINGKGGFCIGPFSNSATANTDFEVDYARVLFGSAVEDSTTQIQSLITCGLGITPATTSNSTAMFPGAATPGLFNFSLTNNGNQSSTYTAIESNESGEPSDYAWLTLDKSGGTIASGASDQVVATLNASGLPAGIYTAYVSFTDNCVPANTYIRRIVLTVYNCQFDVNQNCNVLRSYLIDYPHAVSGVPYTITNTGTNGINYAVSEVDQNGVATDYPWLSFDHAVGSIGVAGSDIVTANINPTGLTAGSYPAYIQFNTSGCLAPTITRQLTLTVQGSGKAVLKEYLGDVDPLTAGFKLRTEAPASTNQGVVQLDPLASDGSVLRIVDTTSAKTKYQTNPTITMSGGIGSTVVSRVRVYGATTGTGGAYQGGLFIWEDGGASAEAHWGGPSGRVREPNRGIETFLADPQQANDQFHIVRVTAVGTDDCNRVTRVYFDENTTPVLELTGLAAQASSPDGLGFGAGNTAGTYDLAFDWFTGTNTGAFAPGEEVAVLGRSLIPKSCNDPFADLDGDKDVDMEDFALFQKCYTGATASLTDPHACGCADFTHDGHIDDFDLAPFKTCANTSRAGVPADPLCDGP